MSEANNVKVEVDEIITRLDKLPEEIKKRILAIISWEESRTLDNKEAS